VTTDSRRALLVGAVGVLIAVGLAGRLLVQNDGDPTIFASFGEESEITPFAEEVLGREVVERGSIGHDGRFFFVLANDPWLTNPEEAQLMDRPAYRAQRMLYPMIAGGAGLLDGEATTWGLIIVNLLAMGLGTWGVATLASDMGGSPWWGLAFVLNVGLISEMNIDGAGVVAAAAAFWAVVIIRRDKMAPGVALLVVSALSREAMLIVAAGSAYWVWRQCKRRWALATVGIPVAAVGLWWLYVQGRLGGLGSEPQVEEIGLPFVGLVQAIEGWLTDPVDLAAGVAIILLLALFTRRVMMSGEIVGWAFLGFVPLAMLFTRQVWLSYFDISRAIAPVLTAFVLLVFIDGSARATVPALDLPTRR
jgi:hypothetical protein